MLLVMVVFIVWRSVDVLLVILVCFVRVVMFILFGCLVGFIWVFVLVVIVMVMLVFVILCMVIV